MADAAERALAAVEAFERTLAVAGHRVDLRIASPTLAERFWPALAHLEAPPSATEPALTIELWDRSSTGVAPPRSPFAYEDHLERGIVRGGAREGVRIAYDRYMRLITTYDRDRATACLHTADPRHVSGWVDRAPFRTVFGWWSDDVGLAFLHSSAVASRDGAVVVAGPSGSGKSTTALSCVAAGWQMLGDDVSLVGFEPSPTVHSLFGLAKVEPDALDRLPALGPMIVDRRADQWVVDLGSARVRRADLRGVVLPRVAGGTETRVTAAAPADVVKALVPASVLEGIGAGPRAVPILSRLARGVPCYHLDLGTDVDGVVAAMARIANGAP
jgi:hypothetical protein